MYGARKSTLEYLIRAKIAVAMPHPGLATVQPHSAEAGSIHGEQALCLSHTHPLYRDDNKSLFSVFEVALCGTTFEASIKPFQSTGEGSGAYEALISQHAGKEKLINISVMPRLMLTNGSGMAPQDISFKVMFSEAFSIST